MPTEDKWPETIRDLIKHENELIANRFTWTAAFQGFLFTALAFSWDKSVNQHSLVILLCLLGISLAGLSFLSLLLAHIAISRLLNKWSEHNKHNSNKDDLLPVWGWIELNSLLGITAPWLILPIFLVLAWVFIWYYHCQRLEPQWESLAQESFKQALLHDKSSDLAKQAITALAHIRGGSPDKGMNVFNKHCVSCHGEPRVFYEKVDTDKDLVKEEPDLVIVALVGTKLHIRIFDGNKKIVVDKEEGKKNGLGCGKTLKGLKEKLKSIPNKSFFSQEQKQIIQDVKSITGYPQSSDKFETDDRKDIVSGILYSNPHKGTCIESTEDVTCMKDGLTTVMSTKDFIDVVEYLKEPKPKKVMGSASDVDMDSLNFSL